MVVGFLVLVSTLHAASIQFISIGVNGLTCSMCTRSVEMSIRRLDFVDSVVMDLENTEGKVYVSSHATPDFRRIAKAVTDAGFSVRFMRISADLSDFSTGGTCFNMQGNTFQWVDLPPPLETVPVNLVLIGPEFMPRRQAVEALKKTTGTCASEKVIYYVRVR